ncbi:MAG: FHA domain-containing protein [Proteobacteria bacterium]|nr:FHA domain-containing protein [Pseudomonadota bacterium]
MAALDEDIAPPVADIVPPRGLVEVIDRDGQARQSFLVTHWPLRIGRALDNDVVLSDPHVAAHHAEIALDAEGPALVVGADAHNAVQVGTRRLQAGDRSLLVPHAGDAVDLHIGRTHLRVRIAAFALAAEMPLAAVATLRRRIATIAIAALVVLVGLAFSTWLQNDPDTLTRGMSGMLMMAVTVTAVWCGAWALLSKTFTRQAHFSWHLRVFLFGVIGLGLVDAIPSLLAFAFSWPWLTDFAFVGTYAIGAAVLYFHLLAVEPARYRMLRWLAIGAAVAGVALTLWLNVQRTDRYGDELYMSHLYPPALRLARPVPTDRFVDGLVDLKPTLDKMAKQRDNGEDNGAPGGDED